LDEIISNEEGMRFQGLAVVLAKQRWPGLIACERKWDRGLDARLPASLASDGIGKGLACSITAALEKIRKDAESVKKHFDDIRVLIFATPQKVSNHIGTNWAREIQREFGYELLVLSREDIITSLMDPSNAPLCRTLLGMPTNDSGSGDTYSVWNIPYTTIPPNNLPTQPTALIGRALEIEEVLETYRRGARLISLIGPGGIGKSHLSLQIGIELFKECPDGVCFIDLAPLENQNLLTQTIIQTLGIRPIPDQSISDSLTEYLHGKQILLILDSFERVLSAAPYVAELLSACPHLKLLVTSQKILNLRGEQEYPVPPLALPPANLLPQVNTLLKYSAIELFVARVQAVKPNYQLLADETSSIVEICSRLDGLPLAIELAAARMKTLSPQALLMRLEDKLKLLTGGSVDLPPRQRTLRGTIDWSYELLSEDEKRLFRRLSVFVRGFSIEAAEAVCSDLSPLGASVLDGITALLNSSLLRQTTLESSEIRFLMLQTIHEYARERLTDSDEPQLLLRRRAEYFSGFVEEMDFAGTSQQTSLRRVDTELNNIRAVLGWCKENEGDPAIGLKIAIDLWLYWEMRGVIAEGRKHIEDLLTRGANHVSNAQRAISMLVAGNLASSQGDSKDARPLYEESLALHESLGDRIHMAGCLTGLGNIARAEGDYLKARALYKEGLAIKQDLGEVWGSAVQFHNLAKVAHHLGELTEAGTLFEQSLAIAKSFDDKRLISRSLAGLGDVYVDKGDKATARSFFQESIKAAQVLGDRLSILLPVLRFSVLFFEEGDTDKSALLLAAGYALHEGMGTGLSSSEENKMDDLKTRICEKLGDQAFEDLWAEGQKISLDQIVDLVSDN
jgi:predicted ATPase